MNFHSYFPFCVVSFISLQLLPPRTPQQHIYFLCLLHFPPDSVPCRHIEAYNTHIYVQVPANVSTWVNVWKYDHVCLQKLAWLTHAYVKQTLLYSFKEKKTDWWEIRRKKDNKTDREGKGKLRGDAEKTSAV